MAVTPARVNQIAQSWQFQQCKWAGPVEAWYRFKRNIFRIPAFSLRFFDVHVVAPAVSKRISEVLSPCERKGSRGVLLVEIHLPGPFLWPTLVFEWACPPRAASPAVLGVWPIELYLPGPITWPFGYRVDLCPPREASPAVLGVCSVELFLPGPFLLAKFGDRVSLTRREWGPSFWPSLVIEWIFVRRERRLRLFWAFGRLSYISRGPSFWPSLVIEWVFSRRERRLRLCWACVRLSYISRGPSFWPSLVD